MPGPKRAPPKADFATFFAIWAELRRWDVPDVHWLAVHWLERRGELAVLRCFRGFGKSTLLAVYNAWRYYRDQTYRILHQGDQDGTAHKTARDTKAVLTRHPLTRHLSASIRGEVSFWWVPGAEDERNPSMQAAGILSNITSSRADEVQNDDVEVPKNIQTPEAREKLRYRLGEQTHILVPGGRSLFVGTPHTHDSLYDEMETMGADCLTIRMFQREHRIDNAQRQTYRVPFRPEFVFVGIGKQARVLSPAQWTWAAGALTFVQPPGGLVDLYAGSAWPERFTAAELLKRRQRTRTINEWDSQYQLHSRPIHDVRLDPAKLIGYDEEPALRMINRRPTMWLGSVQIVGCSLRWDPSSGKTHSDTSALCLDLQDGAGRHYWHRAVALDGEMAEMSPDGHRIIGGQVLAICDVVRQFRITRVTVETNGIGHGAERLLRMALRQQKLGFCSVKGEPAATNKNKRILEALEPLISSGLLWAHVSVLEGPLWDEMREWNPAIQQQPDDFLDAGAGAVTDQPARIGSAEVFGNLEGDRPQDWRQFAGADIEYTLES